MAIGMTGLTSASPVWWWSFTGTVWIVLPLAGFVVLGFQFLVGTLLVGVLLLPLPIVQASHWCVLPPCIPTGSFYPWNCCCPVCCWWIPAPGDLCCGRPLHWWLQSSTKFCCPLCSFHCVHSIGIEGGLVVALEARPDAIGMTGLTSAAPV